MISLDQYRAYNQSHKEKLIFRLGIDAGFFSEFNNMVLAMAWCLTHDIQFQLYSRNAWFSQKGWSEFFEPFCQERLWTIHDRINNRLGAPVNKFHRYFTTNLYQLFQPKRLLTYQTWNSFRNRELEKETFEIPELNLSGNLQTVCRELTDMIWRYNEDTEKEVTEIVKGAQPSGEYIGFHIRGGDKFKEDQIYPFGRYFDEMATRTEIRRAFVLTDDYKSFSTAQKDFLEWKLYSLCEEDEAGYYHQDFMMESKEFIRHKTLRLFASIDILKDAQLFMGTFSSNPGMFLGMRKEASQCVSVDGSAWGIW